MSDTKFTKGEWSTDDMGIVESGNRIVCDTYMTCKEDLANANLIKASPKMYKILESIYESARYAGTYSSEMDEIKAVLAEARGES